MKKISLIFAIIALAAAVSCSPNKRVKILTSNFTGNEPVKENSNLFARFNVAIAKDEGLNEWDSTAYFDIKPKVPGVYKWTTPNELIFSPVNSLAPDTEYELSLSSKFKALIPAGYGPPKNNLYKFRTREFEIESAFSSWNKPESKGGSPILSITFQLSHGLAGSDARSKIQFKIDGKEREFKIADFGDKSVRLEIPDANLDLGNKKAEIKILQGAKLSIFDYQTKKDVSKEFKISSVEDFKITGAKTAERDGDPVVQIHANLGVEKNQEVSKFVEFSPDVDFLTEVNESGILVSGTFDYGETYELTVKKGLLSEFGSETAKNFSFSINFADIEPKLEFAEEDAMYLSSATLKNVELSLHGPDSVTVDIYKVYENNLLRFFQSGRNYGWYWDEETDEDYDYYYYHIGDKGDKIFSETFKTKDLERRGSSYLLKLDFADKLADMKGVYVVKVSDENRIWLQDSRIVAISDIGLFAKSGKNELLVWANSIKSGSSLSSARIRVISSTNQGIAEKRTNSEGIAEFSDFEIGGVQFSPALVAASYGGETNYLLLDYKTQIEMSQYDDVGGAYNTGQRAFLYGDRDLYRPGDTVIAAGIVRNEDMGTPDGAPVKVKLFTPSDKLYKELHINLNSEGGFSEKIYVPTGMTTGSYRITAELPNGTVLATRYINIEDFIPDRIKYELELDSENYEIGDEVKVSASVRNLYGPPAANRKYELDFSMNYKTFDSEKFPDYTFALFDGDRLSGKVNIDWKRREGKTDEEGNLREIIKLDEKFKNSGMISGRVEATVFDETGRTVERSKSFEVQTQDDFLGIGRFDRWVGTDKPLKIPLVVVDKEDNVKSRKVKIEIYRYYWETVLVRRSEYSYYYDSRKQTEKIKEFEHEVSGETSSFSFTPNLSGSYEIKAYLPGSKNYVSRGFYAYSYGTTEETSFKVEKEGSISIEADKDSYEIGSKAELLFKAPFDGKMLVTVDRESNLEHYIVQVKDRSAKLSLTIDKEFFPNVYVTATLIKKLSDRSTPLTSAYGCKAIKIKNERLRLPVEILAADKSRSKTKQTIKIKSAPDKEIFVTLAAVDEGILQIKDYQTPDPFGYFYRKIALQTSAYSLYPFLFPELEPFAQTPGGGEGSGLLEKRSNPMQAKRVKLLAYWSGVLKTDHRGEANYVLDIPEFSGEVRLMACAYKGKAFGSAEKSMTISDPVVISAAVPRFLSPNDSFDMLTTIANTTDNKTGAKVSVKLEGPLKIVETPGEKIELTANAETQVNYRIQAENNVGLAKIRIKVDTPGESFTKTIDIGVRSPVGLVKDSKSGKLEPGESKTLSVGDKYIKGTIDASAVLAISPLVEFSNDLRYLIGYPYGCVEQTTSKAFPQLALRDLYKATSSEKDDLDRQIDDNIRRAIDKLTAMQLYDGSLSFWLGGNRPSWYGSVYAYHFLKEAEAAGYYVSSSTLAELEDYIIDKLGDLETTHYSRYYNGEWTQIERYPRTAAYSLFVLAINGKPQVSKMNFLKSKPELLTQDSKFLLAAAYYAAGDKNEINGFVPAFQLKKEKAETGGSFSSPIRDLSLALYALATVKPDDKRNYELARKLAKEIKGRRYLTTQERSFGLMALSKVYDSGSGSFAASISYDGAVKGEIGDDVSSVSTKFKDQTVTVKNTGDRPVYYFYESEGLSKDGSYVEEDNYLKVRKSFFTPSGSKITNGKFKQGDLVIVEIKLQSEYEEYIENIVVTDMLPAGFEIENPRLGTAKKYDWMKDKSYADHYDFRDDRVNIFTDLGDSYGYWYSNRDYSRTYYYTVRAVTAGKFRMGPVSADAMYNGEYRSYHGAGDVVVEK